MKNSVLLLFLALLALPPISGEAMASNRNIIFISIDDMRVDPQAITPNLDAFASESTVYNNAYTVATYCLPVRTSVMFGLSPATHQIGLTTLFPNPNLPPYSDVYGDPEVKSIPEILDQHGYTTATTGKVFHTPEPDRWDINGPAVSVDDFTHLEFPGYEETFMRAAVWPEGEIHPDQVAANFAIDFINNHDSQEGPFFLALGLFNPHVPRVPQQWAWDMYSNVTVNMPVPGDLDDEPAQAVDYVNEGQYNLIDTAGDAEYHTHAYLASITHTDAMIGQVLAALDASPHADNTDVIIFSDHGYHLGEKFHWRKITYWQETVRVPLMIRAASLSAVEMAEPVSLLDIAPTVLDLAGNFSDEQFEGVSLRIGRSPVEIYHGNGKATIDESNMKDIDYDTSISGDTDRSVYDLLADPEELTNLVVPGC